ncbi:hypothetical protein [Halarcobacter ebronensis]|uniref:Uncharacterized protein n=1 Tax=Halarcobacter ebronensis TaxID=1462615 RepID=A0A4Q1AQD5_9BACT|nr:hypothetical protein [Halarcobacter ebronensis]QKF82916.1 hypothetical protein AEBR_2449 [Halarcobacter ebronensis]RXK06932.1 hypothetical protein CRV07_05755 [Halarcobacter ebronensis]
MSVDFEKLKKLRDTNFAKHKKKKREYYLKSKEKNSNTKYKNYKEIDYSQELNNENFAANIKLIAKKQKAHVDDRKEQILLKIEEYKEKKQNYYKTNRNKRLEYDKNYREKRKEELKEYRKEYYRKNKEKILEKQKEKRREKYNNEK